VRPNLRNGVLSEGKNKLQALSLAKTDLRNQGAAHPFFWASFILAGETD
jgi:CHAT domain-containing protein